MTSSGGFSSARWIPACTGMTVHFPPSPGIMGAGNAAGHLDSRWTPAFAGVTPPQRSESASTAGTTTGPEWRCISPLVRA